MHDALHSDLFIPILDDKIIFDEKGLFYFEEELFDMKNHLSKNMNPGIIGSKLSRFNRISQSNFVSKTFLAGMTYLSISGDDIAAFKSFWTNLNIRLTVANKYNVMYLPSFIELSPHQTVCDHVYPPVTFSHSHKFKFHLDYVGTLIRSALGLKQLSTKAHKARIHINSVIHSNQYGWDILEY